MDRGETFEADQHRTAVCVRGSAPRCGVGSALFRLAEAQVLAAGARSLHVDASLAAVDFYKANGFDEITRGQHRLRSRRVMSCVVMRKDLEPWQPTRPSSSSARPAGSAGRS
jgi:putative acetyltransferase